MLFVGLEIPQLPREFIVAAHRRRAVDAVAEIAHEFGLSAVKTAAVLRVARMGRATFYSLFDGLGGCLRYSVAESHRQVFEPVAAAAGDDWLTTVEAKIGALCCSVTAAPLLAELCLVHSYAIPGETAGADFEAGVEELASQLSQARTEDGRSSIPFVEEFLARALVSLTASRARRGEAGKLMAERRDMVWLVANAYPEAGSQGAVA